MLTNKHCWLIIFIFYQMFKETITMNIPEKRNNLFDIKNNSNFRTDDAIWINSVWYRRIEDHISFPWVYIFMTVWNFYGRNTNKHSAEERKDPILMNSREELFESTHMFWQSVWSVWWSCHSYVKSLCIIHLTCFNLYCHLHAEYWIAFRGLRRTWFVDPRRSRGCWICVREMPFIRRLLNELPNYSFKLSLV